MAADPATSKPSGPRPARTAIIAGLVWLGGIVALAALFLHLPEPWRAPDVGSAAAVGLALTLPAAALALWAGLAGRLAALERAREAEPAPGAAAGPDHETLTRALSAAARDALDAERGAIARQLAVLGDTQRRLEAALAEMPRQQEGGEATAPAQATPEPEPEPARPEPAPAPEPAPEPPSAETAQPDLPLSPEGPAPEAPPRDWALIAAALDFPRDAEDEAGFQALARATRDRPVAELLQAAEDALTMLAQHGLYMEDLEVSPASAELWARFAGGERGAAVAPVGGVQSEEAVESVRQMMKTDPVFRDTAMHLMRRFDGVLRRAAAEPEGQPRLPELADSRTGRAFMLVAQAAGTFD
ncbi:MAG: hypothetical protein ACQEUZ_07290 [Pseudomonadota bacterium]